MGLHQTPVLSRCWRLFLLALVVGCGLVGGSAQARSPFAPGSVCHASLDASESYDSIADDVSRWTCDGTGYDWSKKRFIVRHDLTEQRRTVPRFAEFARHEFGTLTVRVEARDGTLAAQSHRFTDLRIGLSSLGSIVELPQTGAPPQAVIFTLDGGRWPEALAEAQFTPEPSVTATAGLPHLLAALLCGLLLAPMLFDFGYFRALREPFPLYHALFCAMAFVQTAAVSGLIPLLTSIPFQTELVITFLSLDVMVAATMLFAANFIESETLSRRNHRVLGAIAIVALAIGTSTTFKPEWFGAWIDHAYFGVYAILLAGYFTVLARAWKRGSRMAPYLIFGFAPLAAVLLIQLVGVIVAPRSYFFDETWPQNIALLIEVIATALAVADRFMAIRHERDRAVDEARTLENLSERDELTGLRNRRALDAHYESLLEQGFTAMAVLDIDHFKSFNDIYGHPVGDAVLKCTAQALRSHNDPDLLAFRIGGEEFLLMLRGEDARERAEARRRAVTVRTLADMEGLDRPVTASMGFLDFSAVTGEASLDFTALYTRVDQLLYDAKCAGRNRTFADRLKLFNREEDGAGAGMAAA